MENRHIEGVKWKEIVRLQEEIFDLENIMSKKTDEELRAYTNQFRKRFKSGESLDSMIVESFAVCREACFRVLGMKPYWNQIQAGIALHRGSIIEMKTGEGKTLTEVCPAYLNSIEGSSHIATVNRYLSLRDMMQMQPIFNFLDCTVGIITEIDGQYKKKEYESDVVYAVNSELGFDFLRDNQVYEKDMKVQSSRNFLLIDEIDSVIIDDGNTPLLISNPGQLYNQDLVAVNRLARSMKEDIDYILDTKEKSVIVTEKGMRRAESFFGYTEDRVGEFAMDYLLHITNAIKANVLFKRNKDYIIGRDKRSGEKCIILIDSGTGRLAEGRRLSDGLHCAIEAKESSQGVAIQTDDITSASITYRHLLKTYKKKCGMSGTVETEKEEFQDFHDLDIMLVPTNKPPKREDYGLSIYKDKDDKDLAIVQRVMELHKFGRPVLLASPTMIEARDIAVKLKKAGIPYKLLDASKTKEEAHIIAKAGERGAVTVSTPIAGRGTDIKISDEVNELGGLAVIGTSISESVRIDNQLSGRAGRQGNNGSSEFYVSFQDPIVVDFYDIDYPNEFRKIKHSGRLSEPKYERQIKRIQSTIEGMQRSARIQMNKLGDVLWKHQEAIYRDRDRVLDTNSLKSYIDTLINERLKSLLVDFESHKVFKRDRAHLLTLMKELYNNLVYEFKLTGACRPSFRDFESCVDYQDLYEFCRMCCYNKLTYLSREYDNITTISKNILLRTVDVAISMHIEKMNIEEKSNGYSQMKQVQPVAYHVERGTKIFEATKQFIKNKFIDDLFSIEDWYVKPKEAQKIS